MSYCDDCILVDICGCESCYDESLTFCADKHRYIHKSELKDIKEEIKTEIQDCQTAQGVDAWWNGKKYGLEEALDIINKHTKENKQ